MGSGLAASPVRHVLMGGGSLSLGTGRSWEGQSLRDEQGCRCPSTRVQETISGLTQRVIVKPTPDTPGGEEAGEQGEEV